MRINWFTSRASLVKFDEFRTLNPDNQFFVRGSAEAAGLSEEGVVDKDGKLIESITKEPWSPSELEEIEVLKREYQSSFHCDPE